MNFNKMVPELSVSNIQQSKKFYRDILGFKVDYEREEDRFAFISLDGAQLMLDESADGSWNTGITEYPFGRGINFQIFTDDLEGILSRLEKNHIPVWKEPFVSKYRIQTETQVFKELLVQDPDGYLLRFSELQPNEQIT